MKLRRMLCSFLIIAILSVQFDIPVKANRDYLNITLADIIVTWYNASGVAIGSSELFNAIQDTYGSITLNDLVENDCFMLGGFLDSDFAFDKDAIREMIGYGSLAAPAIVVRPDKLMQYLQGYPIRESARDALGAMFGNITGDDLPTEVFSATLGCLLGTVANIGKIRNDIDQSVLENIGTFRQKLNEWWPVKTLKGVYRKFTDSTYFQDLLHVEEEPTGEVIFGTLDTGYVADRFPNATNFGGILDSESNNCVVAICTENVFPVATGNNNYFYVVNVGDTEAYYNYATGTYNPDTKVITMNGYQRYYVAAGQSKRFTANFYLKPSLDIIIGYAIGSDTYFNSGNIVELATPYNPWLQSGGGGGNTENNGVTKYINNQVGNIASDNYINLSPNIGNNEYMYIFDRLTYIEELNQITQNTDNGDYSQNSSVINNYNNQYIQGGVPDVRPTSAPASNPEVQPEMPFVSPRPTQPPEFVEEVVQEGGLSEEITKKFPFCIPWDIKALVDNLWAPEARAPYIHWEATFGEWGKLGEVTVDFSEFDSVARIFRSTTLLLWIVGLVLITRDLIG